MARKQTENTLLDPKFIERWSPRSFHSDPISEQDLTTVLEAARWAPSCFNVQPWRFLVGQGDTHQAVLDVLADANQVWAKNTPVLIVLFATKQFGHNQKDNAWAEFDCGSAWMSIARQAQELGLITHAMAGFDRQRALDLGGLDGDAYQPMTVIALGKKGDGSHLPEDVQKKETPSDRKDLGDLMIQVGG